MSHKALGSRFGFFSGQDPIDAFAGISLQPQQNIWRRCAETQLVLRELGLCDTKYPSELALREVKPAYFPDASPDRCEVCVNGLRASQNIPLTPTHNSCILFSLRL